MSQTGEKKWSLVLGLKEMNPVTIASYDNIRDASEALYELYRQIAEGEERERAWAVEGKEVEVEIRIRIYASELLGDSLFRSVEERENGHRD